ncbi:hypothetical protein DEJ55_11385 [Bacillus pumilus]|uniref:RES domain-containing protein n=1 Tax=Bacillus pumilus TaxID=1408 RepID=UPI000DCA7182|nr:RES domain-containing protein [Bacillus pumilus]RAU04277.1 hypothetical protein DEJ55_11385 [Bacillus pumilus]
MLFNEMIESCEIICCNCTINVLFDEFKLKIDDLDEYPKISVVGYGEEDVLICGYCKFELEPLDMYFESNENYRNAIELTIISVANILSNKIEHCSHCEGEELEYYEYRAMEEEIPFSSHGQEIYDFLCEYNVDEEFHEEIMHNLRCSSCGYGEGMHSKNNPDGGYFSYSDRIYTAQEISEFWGFEKELILIAQIYGVEISLDMVDNFIEYCSNNPMLAFNHELSKLIFVVLKKVLADEERVLKRESDVLLFRGRKRAKDTSKYKIEELGMPPLGISSHGRYNLVGTSVLYLSDNREGIPYEIEPKKNEVIDIATYQVKQPLTLFNVDEIFRDFSFYISKENEESKTLKRNYLFTNFLASACYEIGFDGIYYKGAGDKSYNNIALFEKAISKIHGEKLVDTINFNAIYHHK